MKIAIIGPGIMPIPPVAWGAVEILIWDYHNELTRLGHKVTIINTKDRDDIVKQCNKDTFDFVHLHYDVYYDVLEKLTCPNIAITSHYPYIDQPAQHWKDGYTNIFTFLCTQTKYYNFILADKDMEAFIKYGANILKIKKIKNGIDSEKFSFLPLPIYNKTMYLGQITPRKNQAKYQNIPTIEFVGRCADPNFNQLGVSYWGEWPREKIQQDLTKYTNLLLISEGEADPLVIKEALIAGLGVVVNESSAENLDITKDFITVIDDEKKDDIEYIRAVLETNKSFCKGRRAEIRQYGIEQFDIRKECEKYLDIVNTIVYK
uniref:Glycosyltransferase n=1 Tax=viral metagenome TaxID=1070528 RepID=A0A6C0B6J1_9ZZZZ